MHVEGKSNFETAAVVIYQKRFFRLSVEDPLWFFFLFLAKMMECKSGEWNGFFWLDKSYDKAEFFLPNFPLLQIYFQFEMIPLRIQNSDFNFRIKEMEINILCWHVSRSFFAKKAISKVMNILTWELLVCIWYMFSSSQKGTDLEKGQEIEQQEENL